MQERAARDSERVLRDSTDDPVRLPCHTGALATAGVLMGGLVSFHKVSASMFHREPERGLRIYALLSLCLWSGTSD